MILLSCPQYCHNVFQQLIGVLRDELRQHLHYHANFIMTEDLLKLAGIRYKTIILFGSQHVDNLSHVKTFCEYLIIYNLEQLHFSKWRDMIERWTNVDVDEIWDYSQVNLDFLESEFPSLYQKTRKMHLGYSPFFRICPLPTLDRRLAFIGNMSPHRFSTLSKLTIPYKVYNHHYFDDYNVIVSQHGAFLNIHFQIPAILEIVRILPLVCNRKRVFSERSQDVELDDMFEGLVDFYDDHQCLDEITEENLMKWEENTRPRFEEFKSKHSFQNILHHPFSNHPQWVRNTADVKICIATLHCNDRQTIFKTIHTFFQHTHVCCQYDIEWVILSQGSSEEHNEQIEYQLQQHNIKYTIIPLLVNMGWSNGMNELYHYIINKKFTHVLHLEDDWLCDSSSVGNQWLDDCLIYMTNHEDVSTMFLRQYRSDHEKQYYGWTRSFRYHCFQQRSPPFNYQSKIKQNPKIPFRSLELREIPTFMYTANPTLFKLEDYIKHGVFPFPVFRDASQNQIHWSTTTLEDAPEWGQSEALSMEKLLSTKCMNVNKGIFYHHF